MKKQLLFVLGSLLIAGSTFAQSEKTSNKNKEQTKTRVYVVKSDSTHLGEALAEVVRELSINIERAVENLGNTIELTWNGEENLTNSARAKQEQADWEGLGDRIAAQVESFVNNMDIHITPHDLEEFAKQSFEWDGEKKTGQDILDEIEREHGSKVKTLEHVRIKVREHAVSIHLKAVLENGKRIEQKQAYSRKVKE